MRKTTLNNNTALLANDNYDNWEELAEAARVSRSTLWRWRNGKRVSKSSRVKIEAALLDKIGKEKILITQKYNDESY